MEEAVENASSRLLAWGNRGGGGMGIRHEVVACDDAHLAVATKVRIQMRACSFPQPSKDGSSRMWELHPQLCEDRFPLHRFGHRSTMWEKVNLPDTVGGRHWGELGDKLGYATFPGVRRNRGNGQRCVRGASRHGEPCRLRGDVIGWELLIRHLDVGRKIT